jgi:diaminopimelate epimerase
VKFEKWQALGNDYIVVEDRDLPFPLTPARVARICAPHTGVGSDGILLLSETDERGFVASLRIFNPDGSEAELSGNGAREAVMYLRRRGWTDNDSFSIQTAAGEMRPRITGPTTCTMDMGRAKLTSKDYPSGPEDGTGTVDGYAFQHVSIGNPQCSIEIKDREAPTSRSGPGPARRRFAPASSSAAWERRCPPARVPSARRSQRCCAASTARSRSRSTAASSRWRWGRTCT